MKKIFSIAALALAFIPAGAQTFEDFMSSVERRNVAWIAEKYNVDIAEARTQASRVFNDPEVSVDFSDNQDKTLMMGRSVEVGLSYNLSLAGVRKARMAVARSEEEITRELLRDYFRNLRHEATVAWAEAWRAGQMLSVMRSSFESMEAIAASDSLKAALGEIGFTDARQSSLEARAMKAEVFAAEAEYSNALTALSLLAGGEVILPDKHLELPAVSVDEPLDLLIAKALESRADIRAAELGKTLSRRNLELVKAQRVPELGLNAGYSLNTEVRNEIAPAPKFNGVTVGVSIPLKFSSANKGERIAAQKEMEQAEAAYEAARSQIEAEVRQAWTSYIAALRTAGQCSGEMLSEAGDILENRRKAYLCGDSSLLDYLLAVRVYNDTAESCISASADLLTKAAALKAAVGLE